MNDININNGPKKTTNKAKSSVLDDKKYINIIDITI